MESNDLSPTIKISVSVMCKNIHPHKPVDSEWSDYSRGLNLPVQHFSSINESNNNVNNIDNNDAVENFEERKQNVGDIDTDEKQQGGININGDNHETKFDIENEKMVLQTIQCDLANIKRSMKQIENIHKSACEQSSNSLLSFNKFDKCFELAKTCCMIKDIHKNVEENLRSIKVCHMH